MRQAFPKLRRAAILMVGLCSVAGAAFLVWLLATREQMGTLTNAHLAGMLALFLLPGATMAAWELDRRASLRRAADDVDEAEDEGIAPHAHEATSPRRGAEQLVRHRRRIHTAKVAR